MKRISLKIREDCAPEPSGIHRGKYPIPLTWGKQYYFSSRKRALRFLAIAGQFYTQCMYESRILYIDVWVQYQKDWGYFDHDKPGSGFPLHSKRRSCELALNTCQESFNLMTERDEYRNGSYIVHNKIEVIIASLKEAIDILREMHMRKSTTMELYQLDTFSRRIWSLEHSLKSFGDYEAKYLKKPLIHDNSMHSSTALERAKITASG